MTKTVEEAVKLWCPFASTGTEYCIADRCIAWEWDDSDELDIEETNKHATTDEIMSGHYGNPIFKTSDKGWCKLIDKDY